MDPRIADAIEALKQAKKQGLELPAARAQLAQQGFTETEINLATTTFPYNTVEDPADAAAQKAIAQHDVREQTLEHIKGRAVRGTGLSLLFGKSIIGQFFGTRSLTDMADYHDVKEGIPLHRSPATPPPPGEPVYKRNRLVRYYGVVSIIALLLISPNALSVLTSVIIAPGILFTPGHGVFISWVLVGYLAYFVTPFILFRATKEKTIRDTYYIVSLVMAIFLVILSIVTGSPIILLGAVMILPSLWISRQVGLLSKL